MGHDLSFPSLMVKRGWRAVYEPGAVATEKMVPTIEGEWRRKRRMMSHAWPIVLRGGLLDPRGYDPLYTLMVASHRLLRYAAPALHAAIVLSALAGRDRPVQRLRSPPTPPCWRGRAGGRQRRVEAAAARALLRADHRLAGRRPLRPPPPRHAGGVGGARGDAMSTPATPASARSTSCSPRARWCSWHPLGVVALIIRLETHGHPIYRQRRVGRDGVPFELYKLRTMVTGAESMGPGLVVDKGDARITRTGALLRRSRSTSCRT